MFHTAATYLILLSADLKEVNLLLFFHQNPLNKWMWHINFVCSSLNSWYNESTNIYWVSTTKKDKKKKPGKAAVNLISVSLYVFSFFSFLFSACSMLRCWMIKYQFQTLIPLLCFITVPPEITETTTQINKWRGTDRSREMDGRGKRWWEKNGRKKRGREGSWEG